MTVPRGLSGSAAAITQRVMGLYAIKAGVPPNMKSPTELQRANGATQSVCMLTPFLNSSRSPSIRRQSTSIKPASDEPGAQWPLLAWHGVALDLQPTTGHGRLPPISMQHFRRQKATRFPIRLSPFGITAMTQTESKLSSYEHP